MRKISLWAKYHVWQSRVLIALFYILLNAIGIFIGKLLKETNIVIPEIYFTACLIFTLVLWIGYPNKNILNKKKSPSSSYVHRKIFDFSLGVITLLMIIYIGNNQPHLFIKNESAKASKLIRLPKDSSLYNNSFIQNFIQNIKSKDINSLSAKEKLHIIKKQIREIKHDKETSKSDKTLLIILSIIVAIALLIGVGSLACSLSCAGSEALALLVGIGGTVLVISLLFFIIKRINNPRVKKVEETQQ